MKALKNSPKTTGAAIAALVALAAGVAHLLLDGDPATNPEWGLVGAQAASLLGLLLARDNDVTSEQAGA